jgi:UDPglucose--hexose-1-phosphate uridylyltransferase
LLSDYLAEEHERQERILFANEHFSALIPYWTVRPFESIVIALRNVTYLDELPQPKLACWQTS